MRKLFNIVFLGVMLLICATHVAWAQKAAFSNLGTYPGGTWFTTESINDLGVVVGRGDVPPDGFTHPLAVSLFGPHAGEWVDLGTLGGVQPKGFEYEAGAQISNTGLVVSHSTAPDGYEHGVAWTKGTGLVDLGTLADTDSAFADYKSSIAGGTNKLGTLIVGWCLNGDGYTLPVVWTPTGKPGGWKIHALDTTAGYPYGRAWWVNDYGQLSGVCGIGGGAVIGVVWNRRADGKGWQIMSLPLDPDYPNSNAYGINDRGEITGVAISADGGIWLPRLWKPLDTNRTTYSQPIVLALPQAGFKGCESVGINDLGDIVGDCWNNGRDLPARWIAEDPTFSEIIEFPGSWGYSWGVNSDGIAAVTYGGGKSCPGNTYITCGGATELPDR